MSTDQRKEMREPISYLAVNTRDAHYSAAHDAAANIYSGVFDAISVDVHDLVHEAAMAAYAAALSDLERGKLEVASP